MQRSDLKPQQFRVVGHTLIGDVTYHDFAVGDILVVAHDDGTSIPLFRRVSDGMIQYVPFEDLEVVE